MAHRSGENGAGFWGGLWILIDKVLRSSSGNSIGAV